MRDVARIEGVFVRPFRIYIVDTAMVAWAMLSDL